MLGCHDSSALGVRPPPNPLSCKIPGVQPPGCPSSPAALGASYCFFRPSSPPAFLLCEQKQPCDLIPVLLLICPSCSAASPASLSTRMTRTGASMATSWSSGSPAQPPHPPGLWASASGTQSWEGRLFLSAWISSKPFLWPQRPGSASTRWVTINHASL